MVYIFFHSSPSNLLIKYDTYEILQGTTKSPFMSLLVGGSVANGCVSMIRLTHRTTEDDEKTIASLMYSSYVVCQ